MHALTILHRILSASLPEIHSKRLASLLAAVAAVVSGSRMTLSDMGRGLSGPVSVKHNIKRIDRLLGNSALHTEVPSLYEALVRRCMEGISMPLIIIDWSDLTPDRQWQLLRASVAIEGRSMTLYEQVHPQSRATSARVHQAFLKKLATMLPTGCVPILITDAGFRGSAWSLAWAGVGSAAFAIVTWSARQTMTPGLAARLCIHSPRPRRSHSVNTTMCAIIHCHASGY